MKRYDPEPDYYGGCDMCSAKMIECADGDYVLFDDVERSAMCEANAQPQLYEGWRDMRQELPPIEHQAYFVYDKEGSMGFAHYLGEGIFGGWQDVIAWMPLPSPPVFI